MKQFLVNSKTNFNKTYKKKTVQFYNHNDIYKLDIKNKNKRISS